MFLDDAEGAVASEAEVLEPQAEEVVAEPEVEPAE
jgi:hypothetical protein